MKRPVGVISTISGSADQPEPSTELILDKKLHFLYLRPAEIAEPILNKFVRQIKIDVSKFQSVVGKGFGKPSVRSFILPPM